MYKKSDARAELLFCSLNPLLFLALSSSSLSQFRKVPIVQSRRSTKSTVLTAQNKPLRMYVYILQFICQ